MDDASRLDKVIVERGWRYTWLGSDPYVFDERTEYLARISPSVLGRLSTGTPAGSLGEVLRDLAESPTGAAKPTLAS